MTELISQSQRYYAGLKDKEETPEYNGSGSFYDPIKASKVKNSEHLGHDKTSARASFEGKVYKRQPDWD